MKNKLIASLVPVLLVALGLLFAPLASAATSPSVRNGVVHACMKVKGKPAQRGMIRIVGPTQKCNRKRGWKALNWNITGAAGAKGDTGPQGSGGSQGADGATGAEGKRGEQGSGATVENQLKEVIASQAKEIEKLTDEVSTLSSGLGTVEGTVGTALATANTAKTTAETATDKAGEAVTSVTTLAGKVSGQCSALNEVSTQANELTAGVSELTGALNAVLFGFLPKLPENSKGVTC
jgi:outer membrane murein-binding lipoprotein Lpp